MLKAAECFADLADLRSDTGFERSESTLELGRQLG